ncbi:hypothetical protein RSAG8_04702, partial [Rhizoctonia solani AG-8 WAC10335]
MITYLFSECAYGNLQYFERSEEVLNEPAHVHVLAFCILCRLVFVVCFQMYVVFGGAFGPIRASSDQ